MPHSRRNECSTYEVLCLRYMHRAGSLSGVIISACVQPLDVLRTRMQGEAAKGVSHGTLVTLRLVLDQYGVRCSPPIQTVWP